MGSSTQKTESQSSTTPWGPQAEALTNAFTAANGALSQAQGAKAPTDYTAQFTPDQLATFKSMLGYANGTDTGNLTSSGNTNVTNGTNATQGALSGLGSFNPATANNPAALVDTANKFVDGQNIPAQVRQAMQSGMETARDVTLPGIERGAAVTGNADSSRTGIAQGLVERGLAENAANLSGALSGQAFANGLSLAENQASTNNAQSLGALTSAGNIGNQTTSTGISGVNNGINDQGALFSIAGQGGAGLQAADQAKLTNELQQYQGAVSNPFDALKQYMSIVGGQSWGGNTSGTSTQTSTPSAWSVIGGLLGGVGSLAGTAGKLGWSPFG